MHALHIGLDDKTTGYLEFNQVTLHKMFDAEYVDDVLEWVKMVHTDVLLVNLDYVSWGPCVAHEFRKKGINIPVIGITYNSDRRSDRRADFLEKGGDDLFLHPVNFRELLASVRACCRRIKGINSEILTFNVNNCTLVINRTSKEVIVDGHEIHFTGNEFSVLELLCVRAPRLQSREAIYENLYPNGNDGDPDIKIVDVYLSKVRKKLDRCSPDAKNLIKTVWGKGFKMVRPR